MSNTLGQPVRYWSLYLGRRLLAYLIAVWATVLPFNIFLANVMIAPQPPMIQTIGAGMATAAFTTPFAAALAFPFTLVAWLFSGRLPIPRPILDIAIGAVIAGVAIFVFTLNASSRSPDIISLTRTSISASGTMGGLVFWLLVGRPRRRRVAS